MGMHRALIALQSQRVGCSSVRSAEDGTKTVPEVAGHNIVSDNGRVLLPDVSCSQAAQLPAVAFPYRSEALMARLFNMHAALALALVVLLVTPGTFLQASGCRCGRCTVFAKKHSCC